MASTKKRHWAAVVYPDSLPDNWRCILLESGLPVAVSPLHDRDLDPTNEKKKPHYHLILCYPGPTTYAAVKRLTDQLHAPGPQPLDSVKGYYRYLTHKDNPEKAQYDESQIERIGGFNPLDYADLTRTERLELVKRMQQFVIDRKVYEYCDLLDSLMGEGEIDLYDFVSCNTLLCNTYVTSRRHKRKDDEAAEAARRLQDCAAKIIKDQK